MYTVYTSKVDIVNIEWYIWPMVTKSKAPYHHGDLRNSLIEAAISLIREKGPKAFSLREVAKKAGVSHGAPYRHFADREGLLAAIATYGFTDLAERVQAVRAANPNDPLAELRQAGQAYVSLAVENPEMIQLMFGGYIDKDNCADTPLSEASERAFNELLETVTRCQQAGLMKPASTEVLALTTWSLMHGAAMLIAGGNMSEEVTGQSASELLDNMQTILFQGMGNSA